MTLIENMLSVNGVAFLMFCIFAIAALGYGLGRITIKGVNLGTAGVFIVALLFGCFFFLLVYDKFLINLSFFGLNSKNICS